MNAPIEVVTVRWWFSISSTWTACCLIVWFFNFFMWSAWSSSGCMTNDVWSYMRWWTWFSCSSYMVSLWFSNPIFSNNNWSFSSLCCVFSYISFADIFLHIFFFFVPLLTYHTLLGQCVCSTKVCYSVFIFLLNLWSLSYLTMHESSSLRGMLRCGCSNRSMVFHSF